MLQKDIDKILSENKGAKVAEFELDGMKVHAIFSKPSRHVIGLAMAKSQGNILSMVDVVVENCWLDGDAIIREDDGLYASLISVINELMGMVKASIKN